MKRQIIARATTILLLGSLGLTQIPSFAQASDRSAPTSRGTWDSVTDFLSELFGSDPVAKRPIPGSTFQVADWTKGGNGGGNGGGNSGGSGGGNKGGGSGNGGGTQLE